MSIRNSIKLLLVSSASLWPGQVGQVSAADQEIFDDACPDYVTYSSYPQYVYFQKRDVLSAKRLRPRPPLCILSLSPL
jgi:hypothetical protein